MEQELKTYILHWKTGEDEEVKGYDIADACRRAGIGHGALPALDYYEEAKPKLGLCFEERAKEETET
jgi:hypothetical protein